jgi:hypothetical protein
LRRIIIGGESVENQFDSQRNIDMATAPAPPLAPPLLVDPIKHYDIRGQGAYGLVVSPALGNIDERGQPIQFPGMVSKIMQSQDSFDKAVRAAETMRARIPSLAQEFTIATNSRLVIFQRQV